MAKRAKKTPGINGSSSADIAFMLLIFFLITTSMNEIVISKTKDEIETLKIEELKDRTVEFITNPKNDENLPEQEVRECGMLGNQKVVTSGYAISLKSEVESSYQTFVNVQNELIRAYKEVWEAYSQEKFKKSFDSLKEDQKKAVTKAYPIHISEMPLSNLDKK